MKKTYLYPEMELALPSYESEMSLYKPVFETAIKQLKEKSPKRSLYKFRIYENCGFIFGNIFMNYYLR